MRRSLGGRLPIDQDVPVVQRWQERSLHMRMRSELQGKDEKAVVCSWNCAVFWLGSGARLRSTE